MVEPSDTRNEAGGYAYKLDPRQALAQYANTGTFGGAFYASAQTELSVLLSLVRELRAEGFEGERFVAKTAVWAKEKGLMKDAPVVLLAALVAPPKATTTVVPGTAAAAEATFASPVKGMTLDQARADIFNRAFKRVVTDGKSVRNFAQVIRSGVTGRKSFGTRAKRAIQKWFERDPQWIFRGSMGAAPRMADVVKMVHPKPLTESHAALFQWLTGREVKTPDALPSGIVRFEAWNKLVSQGKAGSIFANVEIDGVPEGVPFEMLCSAELSTAGWKALARAATWNQVRINLNAFAEHGVFKGDEEITAEIAARLRDPNEVERARVFPYSILTAHENLNYDVPKKVKDALLEALDLALVNVPVLGEKVYVLTDVSGSMRQSVTGQRGRATSVMTCVEVAAMTAVALQAKNPAGTEIVPFSGHVHEGLPKSRKYMETYRALHTMANESSGTRCSAPLKMLNERKAKADVIVLLSDNQSWLDSPRDRSALQPGITPEQEATAYAVEWAAFSARNPDAKLICVDLAPYGTVQVKDRENVLHVGGFSDATFEVMAKFVAGKLDARHWVGEIEAIEL